MHRVLAARGQAPELDGRMLHGAPSSLEPPPPPSRPPPSSPPPPPPPSLHRQARTAQPAVPLRSPLVNLWLNHAPGGAAPARRRQEAAARRARHFQWRGRVLTARITEVEIAQLDLPARARVGEGCGQAIQAAALELATRRGATTARALLMHCSCTCACTCPCMCMQSERVACGRRRGGCGSSCLGRALRSPQGPVSLAARPAARVPTCAPTYLPACAPPVPTRTHPYPPVPTCPARARAPPACLRTYPTLLAHERAASARTDACPVGSAVGRRASRR